MHFERGLISDSVGQNFIDRKKKYDSMMLCCAFFKKEIFSCCLCLTIHEKRQVFFDNVIDKECSIKYIYLKQYTKKNTVMFALLM